MRLAQGDVTEFWNALNLGGDPTRVRDALLEVYPDVVAGYGDASAAIAADWYDQLRDAPPSVARFQAVMASAAAREQAESAARWALGPLFEGEGGTLVLEKLMGVTQRLVMQPGRDTIFDSAGADSYRTGVARVPQGVTCRFCTMLASRGPVYRSEVSAELVVGRGSTRTGYDANGKRLVGGIGGGIKPRGNQPIAERFHDNCDCATVVIRSPSDYPDGYDPDRYLDLYKAGSGIGRDIPATD